MNHYIRTPLLFVTSSALCFGCSGVDKPKEEVRSFPAQESALTVAAAANEHTRDPVRMEPSEFAALVTQRPSVPLPIDIQRQRFGHAFSLLVDSTAQTQSERNKMLVSAVMAAEALPAQEQSVAKQQLARFYESGGSTR